MSAPAPLSKRFERVPVQATGCLYYRSARHRGAVATSVTRHQDLVDCTDNWWLLGSVVNDDEDEKMAEKPSSSSFTPRGGCTVTREE